MAVKKFRSDDPEKLVAAHHEYAILNRLKGCARVVQVKDFFEEQARNTTYTVMEYIKGDSIQEYTMNNLLMS